MSVTVTLDDILTVPAEAAVLPLEMTGRPTEGRAAQRLAQAGGDALRRALRSLKFLPVGSAAALETEGLPFGHVIVTPVPRWLTGKANELLALRRCYEAVYDRAAALGLGRLPGTELAPAAAPGKLVRAWAQAWIASAGEEDPGSMARYEDGRFTVSTWFDENLTPLRAELAVDGKLCFTAEIRKFEWKALETNETTEENLG